MNFNKIVTRVGIPRLEELLESNVNIDEKGHDGRTALFRTARIGKESHVKLLLQHHANPNITDNNDESPLQAAVRYGHVEVVKMLINAGADINHCPDPNLTEYSESIICSAVRKKHREVLIFLLQRNGDPNIGTSACRFPIIYAASNSDHSSCKLLLENGAEVNQVDEWGQTALHHVMMDETGEIKNAIETARLLINHGANINAQCIVGETPIHCAISGDEKSIPLINLILKSSPDLGVQNSYDETPLDKAIRMELPEQMELLRLAGGQESHDDRDQEVLSNTQATEAGDVIIQFEISNGSELVEDIDIKLAQEITDSKPSLFKNYGWESSMPHWRLLKHCDKPITLDRIAYFVRGWVNQPLGKEFEDGPDILGEHYQDAVDRFVSEGLLRLIEGTDYIELVAKVPDLKAILKSKNLPVSGSKTQLLDRIIGAISVKEICSFLPQTNIYILTESGKTKIAESEEAHHRIAKLLEEQIIQSLEEPNLLWGLLLATEYTPYTCYTRASISPKTIAKTRLILNNPIPHEISFEKNQEGKLRAVTAACLLCDFPFKNNWNYWGIVPNPKCNGDILSPYDLGSLIYSNSDE